MNHESEVGSIEKVYEELTIHMTNFKFDSEEVIAVRNLSDYEKIRAVKIINLNCQTQQFTLHQLKEKIGIFPTKLRSTRTAAADAKSEQESDERELKKARHGAMTTRETLRSVDLSSQQNEKGDSFEAQTETRGFKKRGMDLVQLKDFHAPSSSSGVKVMPLRLKRRMEETSFATLKNTDVFNSSVNEELVGQYPSGKHFQSIGWAKS